MIKVIHDDIITFFEQEYLLLNNSLGKFRSGKKKKKTNRFCAINISCYRGLLYFRIFKKEKKKEII